LKFDVFQPGGNTSNFKTHHYQKFSGKILKRFQNIQNLILFFIFCFLGSGLALIFTYQKQIYVVGVASLVTLGGTWLMVRSLLTLRGYFHAFKQREARLILLASRDPATGLFQRNGFETLLSKEIERAKRKDYTLSVVLVQVEPLDKIQNDIGLPALERLLFQVAETLQNACRIYDSVFKLDTNTFVLFFAETRSQELAPIVKRLQQQLHKSSFLVNTERVKVIPVFKMGAAVYPIDGTNPQSLEAFARYNLSENFDAEKMKHPEKAQGDFFEIMPTVKAEDPVKEETPAVHYNLDTKALEGTPEMQAFQSELKSLFTRTEAIEESVQKLLQDDPATQIPVVETKQQDVFVEEPAKVVPIESGFKISASEKGIEPLPSAGLAYFQRPAKIVHKKIDVVTAKQKTEKPLSVVNDEGLTNNSWSVEDIANMPDVVAAIMQNQGGHSL